MIENPQKFSKLTELWGKANKNKYEESSEKYSDKDISNEDSKIKYFDGFNQMNEHRRERNEERTEFSQRNNSMSRGNCKSQKIHNISKNKKKKEFSKKKKRGQSRSVSQEKSKFNNLINENELLDNSLESDKNRRKNSIRNTDILKQNLEDHQSKKIELLSEKMGIMEKEYLNYKKKAKKELRNYILKNEEFEREKTIKYIKMEKERLGEFIIHNEMTKTKEIWKDGFLLKDIKSKLFEIREIKDNREKFKKSLKKRKGTKITADEIISGELILKEKSNINKDNSFNFLANDNNNNTNNNTNNNNNDTLMGASYLFNQGILTGNDKYMNPISNLSNNFEKSINSVLNSQINKYDFSFEETKEIVAMQLMFLNKKEAYLRDQLDILETQKRIYLKKLRLVLDEENCRFANRSKFYNNSLKQREEIHSPWPLLNERYQILSLLGKGGFSEVYKAYDLEKMKFVACKIHQLNPHWSLNSRSNYIRHALRENQVHRFLKHLNIVEHFDSVEIDSNSFCTILEYCNGPDLSTYIKQNKSLSEKEAKMIVKQILSGLLFLNKKHDAKIIHYDLKPQNILFHDGVPKISDFGLCKVMNTEDTKLELTSQGVGTYYYLPPECFIRDRDNPILISTKVDIWSLGVIFYEMIYGFKPFGHNLTQERILKEGIMLKAHYVNFPAKPNISNETKHFIKKALSYNQEDRIDVFEAYELLTSSNK